MPVLVNKIREFLLSYREPRFRDGRAWNASEIVGDARDLYWKKTGEPETNPTDLVGALKMRCGKWLEEGLVKEILGQLHHFNMHLLHPPGAQVQVGGTAPVAVNGYLDALMVERKGDQWAKTPWVIEVKTKYGAGASFIKKDFNPGDNYLAQMGYYLRDLTAKGVTSRGMFLFLLMGDDCWGELWEILCKYEPETGEVVAYQASPADGSEEPREIEHRFNVEKALARLAELEKAIADKKLPPADKVYKYQLTPDFLESVSDYQLSKMLAGEKVAGDWEIIYSRYKNKHLELQGGPGYTDQEMGLIYQEYKRRTPKGKKTPVLRSVGG